TTTTLTQTACDSFEWHGTTYTESGSHQFVTTNAVGCTHTETLALTITKSTSSTLTQTACDSFEWHGTTYTESGTYQFTSTNAAGCKHIETLDLKINKSTSSMQTKTTCDSFEWNGITYTESGTYQFTSTNAASCTHIETLDLKINKSTSSMQTKTTCDSFEWNGKTYTQSGAYQFKTTNEVGCTHTDNLDLEIVLFDEALTYANNLLTVKQSNVDYQWINCNNGKTIEGEINQFFKPKENGKYAVIMSIGECKKQSECFEVADLTELEFKVYPNPFTTEVLTIVIPDTTDYEIVFLNSLGIEMVNYKGNSSNFLNVNFVYESGVYIVILKQNGKIKSLKLVRD
ncbi:MAG: T9SS type A sorting domain-containing protein, partial [Chryseotalea sp.]